MKFNLKNPCADCPFRNDKPEQQGWLGEDRARDIAEQQGTFPCHKTTSVTLGEDASGDKEQQCAGMLIMLERMNQPNQMMRIAERLRMYDRTKLNMDAPVFDDAQDFIEWHGEGA